MKYMNYLIIGFIVISLILNMVMLNEINKLEDKISYLQSENSQIRSLISSFPGKINQILNKIEISKRWLTPVKIDISDYDLEHPTLKASWQIKDYEKGSQVIFHYKTKDDPDFQSIAAVNKGGGYFEAEFLLNNTLEPNLVVEIHHKGEASVKRSINDKVEKISNILNYYVSVEKDEKVKSSESENFYINSLANRLYNHLIVSLAIFDGKYSVSVHEESYNNSKRFNISSIYLKAYKDDEVFSTMPLEKIPESKENLYHISCEKDFERLVLVFKYNNGQVFEKEIFKK